MKLNMMRRINPIIKNKFVHGAREIYKKYKIYSNDIIKIGQLK